jgi:hypothetical protein
MEDCWPSGVALRGETSNYPKLRWMKTVVVSVGEKAHEMCQVGIRKTCQSVLPGDMPRWGVVVEASKIVRRHRNRGIGLPSGLSLAGARVLARWCPAWRRREPGLRLLHGT